MTRGFVAVSPGHVGIEILGVGAASIQGHIRFIKAAQMMGARIESTPNSLRISRDA